MKRVLVVGDVMFDKYNYVKTERQAPEAPIPVWDSQRIEYRPGGAANVAANVRSIADKVNPKDIAVYLLGIVDKSDSGREIHALNGYGVSLMFLAHGHSMIKERFVNNGKIIFRHDDSKFFDPDDVAYFEKLSLGYVFKQTFDAVVFSDYDKGTITQKVVDRFRKMSKISVVDSKRADLGIYEGCNVLKLNEFEYSKQVSLAANSPSKTPIEMKFANVVVTKGSRGAELRQFSGARYDSENNTIQYSTFTEEFPTAKVKQVDVTGCGDTHTAAMTVSLINDPDPRRAVKFANECASQVVQKFGTTIAT